MCGEVWRKMAAYQHERVWQLAYYIKGMAYGGPAKSGIQ